ncbi:MAG TPA: ABC transporter ATP-binding protein, partial [Egibacteraceae bacterium]|nr:ABC transporter ATP-binding protein [Egibacteraceae bacterium]
SGVSWGGHPGAGGFSGIAGHRAFQGSRAAGLPFAGVPPELQAAADAVVAAEPEHPAEPTPFAQDDGERRPLTLRRLLAPHRRALLGAAGLVVAETATMQAGPLLTQIAIDDGIRAGDPATLLAVSAAYAAIVGLNGAVTWGRVRWTARVGERLLYRLRLRVFAHLQRLSLDYYEREPAGRLMTRMTSDIEALAQLFHEGLVQLAVQGLIVAVVTAVLFALDPALAAITVLGVLPAVGVLTVWFRARSDRAYLAVRDRIADVVAHLAESLAGIRTVAAHNRHRHNLVVHRNVVGAYHDANDRTARVAALYSGASELVGVAGQAFVLAVGGMMVRRGTLTIGELAAFVLYLTQFFAPIQQLVQVHNAYQRGQSAMTYLRRLLTLRPSVPERPGAVELPLLEGAISFEDVSFAYEPGAPVLHTVPLPVAPGETVALVGASGAGKSTLAKLVARFHDPTSGRVRVDGHDLRDVTLASLRRQLGSVPQEPFLFAGSIRDNIAFARPDASDAELWQACAAVGLDELLARLPDGLDTPCHERGVTLSAGERQLLALARALLARPRVLLLDEATANLDLQSEARIERALDALLEGRTAVLIAHRLATAMRADRIVVLHDGQVAEDGSHDELVARGGRYARLHAVWQAQAAGRAA